MPFRFVHSDPIISTSMGAPGEWFVTVEGKPFGAARSKMEAGAAADWFEDAWPHLARLLSGSFDSSSQRTEPRQ